MFEDVHLGGVSIAGTIKAAVVADSSVQTQEIELRESYTNTTTVATTGCQTDANEQRSDPDVLEGFEGWRPPRGFAEFLERVAPLMEEQLQANADSQAFLDYSPSVTDDIDGVALRCSLTVDFTDLFEKYKSSGGDKLSVLNCTGVSWNATGSTLAASFGRLDIVGWCDVPGALVCWNVFRRDLDDSAPPPPPEIVLDHSSCLMCLAYHPTCPALVAAGSFNGEVLIWDTAADDPLIASSQISDYLHREPVTQVAWVYNMQEPEYGYRLVSTSSDGKVLFWSLADKLSVPLGGYRIQTTAARISNGERGTSNGRTRSSAAVSCTCLSVSCDGKSMPASSAMIGCGGGALLRLGLALGAGAQGINNTEVAALVNGAAGDVPWESDAARMLMHVTDRHRATVQRQVESRATKRRLKRVTLEGLFASRPDPAVFYLSPHMFNYDRHEGPVSGVACSPFHRSLALSCGVDGTVGLHSGYQAHTNLTFEPSSRDSMTAVSWSSARPLVFAVVGSSGVVSLYDLFCHSSLVPAVQFSPPAATPGAALPPCFCLSFNPRQRAFLATGDGSGKVHVWQMSWRLSNMHKGELQALESLAGADSITATNIVAEAKESQREQHAIERKDSSNRKQSNQLEHTESKDNDHDGW